MAASCEACGATMSLFLLTRLCGRCRLSDPPEPTPLQRCGCPGVSGAGCPCEECHGAGWCPEATEGSDADYRERYCSCAAGERLRLRDGSHRECAKCNRVMFETEVTLYTTISRLYVCRDAEECRRASCCSICVRRMWERGAS